MANQRKARKKYIRRCSDSRNVLVTHRVVIVEHGSRSRPLRWRCCCRLCCIRGTTLGTSMSCWTSWVRSALDSPNSISSGRKMQFSRHLNQTIVASPPSHPSRPVNTIAANHPVRHLVRNAKTQILTHLDSKRSNLKIS